MVISIFNKLKLRLYNTYKDAIETKLKLRGSTLIRLHVSLFRYIKYPITITGEPDAAYYHFGTQL